LSSISTTDGIGSSSILAVAAASASFGSVDASDTPSFS